MEQSSQAQTAAPAAPLLPSAVNGLSMQVPWRHLRIFTILLALVFSYWLFKLGKFAFRSELNSHVVLIPFISFYLAWIGRHKLRLRRTPVPVFLLGLGLLAGCCSLAALLVFPASGVRLTLNDSLSVTMFAFVSFFVAGCSFFLGRSLMQQLRFPIAFLIFLIPVPTLVAGSVSLFFQETSAEVADVMFRMVGEPLMREGMIFRLPGLVLRVAEECSGIRSSFVLFITALLAGYMFLRSPWKRLLLAGFVIPLAIGRNAFRIFIIAEGTIHINPKIIDSALHHHGGPLFFAMSLVPFFGLLIWLRKSELKKSRSASTAAPVSK
jgi:exosortase C (VPDSG-CTERM-specific)